LCIGTGGLGSPAALYLAAAGVGVIGLLDFDEVDTSNLHRQILFRTRDVGRPKADVARETLEALNPTVKFVTHGQRLDRDNVSGLLAGYDVIIDGTDNFPTRYLINDTCVRLGKPDVWASVYRFEGQVSVFDARTGPCYRCLFPAIPPDEEIPSCAEAGVLGVLPGILGTTQALEAIKLLLGIGQPLIGRLMTFDALAFAWRELTLEKDPDCRACGPLAHLDVEALQLRMLAEPSLVLIDCREPFEWDICRLEGSRLVPLGELNARLAEFARDRAVVVVCYRGPRSVKAARTLLQAGFAEVGYLEGGLSAWAQQVDPAMAQY
jgi:molybdopterin/thiamine biosynthesis adenylyltransferase/rhodanese-related sulfurtransferase